MTLELRNVSKHFPGVLAVDNVSFSAVGGEITGYLGPNGSGKSTTMKMIAGLIEIGSGEILFGGESIRHDLLAHKQRTGYVPEEPHLYAHLSGLEYLTMVSQLRGLPAKRSAERIDGLARNGRSILLHRKLRENILESGSRAKNSQTLDGIVRHDFPAMQNDDARRVSTRAGRPRWFAWSEAGLWSTS